MDLETHRSFEDANRNIGYLRERIYSLECEIKELRELLLPGFFEPEPKNNELRDKE